MKLPFNRFRTVLLLPALLLLGACATNRSYISLDVPSSNASPTAGKVAVIDEIIDSRDFQENPREPSTPSLKKGESYKLDSVGRLQAIARKRNGYGKAIGDIQLQPPQNVQTITRQLISKGLAERGYRVVAPGEAAPDGALRFKVDIEKFWAWLNPGFWTLRMDAEITTKVTYDGARQGSFNVSASGNKHAQTGMEGNWKQSYERTFEEYLKSLEAALEKEGI